MRVRLFLAIVVYGLSLPLSAQELTSLAALEKNLTQLAPQKAGIDITATIEALHAINNYTDWETFSAARQAAIYEYLKRFKQQTIDPSKSILGNLVVTAQQFSQVAALRDELRRMQLRVARSLQDAFCKTIIATYGKLVTIPSLKAFPSTPLQNAITKVIERYNMLLVGEDTQQGWDNVPLHSLSSSWRPEINALLEDLFGEESTSCREEWLTKIYNVAREKLPAPALRTLRDELHILQDHLNSTYGTSLHLDRWVP